MDYKKEWLSKDLIAGLITAAVVIPKAMAYSTIACLPVQVGLYTAFMPMVIYATLGVAKSRWRRIRATARPSPMTLTQANHCK